MKFKCAHKWGLYQGFRESYEYCKTCGIKQSEATEENTLSVSYWDKTGLDNRFSSPSNVLGPDHGDTLPVGQQQQWTLFTDDDNV